MDVIAIPTTDEVHQYLTTFVVDGVLAIDAGCLGAWSSADAQERVRHVFLSHHHADHVASLPMFLESAYNSTAECITLHATEQVIAALRRGLFNDELWPDLFAWSERMPDRPFLRVEPLEPEVPVECGPYRITPIPVSHAVPTLGFLIEDATSAVLFPSDTGPTQRIWQIANDCPKLRAVFLECSFPDELVSIASRAGHLTPSLFAAETEKVTLAVDWIAVHIKSRYRDETVAQLADLGREDIQPLKLGVRYRY